MADRLARARRIDRTSYAVTLTAYWREEIGSGVFSDARGGRIRCAGAVALAVREEGNMSGVVYPAGGGLPGIWNHSRTGRRAPRIAGYDGVSPKAVFREGVSRSGFEIPLEFDCAPVILKANVRCEFPRPVFSCVGRTSGVMSLKPCVEILGDADIALIWGEEALKEIDVLH